jgi:ectoine hydroxylase-related dioxygenase (phytanoyl-CoA dioxygenase family)
VNQQKKILFAKNGYVLLEQFFDEQELSQIEPVLLNFHNNWKEDNLSFYSKQAINSAYITGDNYLSNDERSRLFQFIGSSKINSVAAAVMSRQPAFMNTQLFFNPVNPEQKNYWHRDPQYHLSPEELKATLNDVEVLHFRVPLFDEPGIELVPGSHQAWDTEEELDVRMEKNGKTSQCSLSSGIEVPLKRGDLLIFSGNMIHRGLYGKDRLSFDLLLCSPEKELIQFVRDDCLPNKEQLNLLQSPEVFVRTLAVKNS